VTNRHKKNVPGKVQEFLLFIVDACSLSEKIQGLPFVSALNKKKKKLYHVYKSFYNFSKFENLNFSE
jgi:hypothetical protein